MKNLLRVSPWVALCILFCLGTSASFSCTPPPPQLKSSTWAFLARVQVTYDSNLNLKVGSAPAPMATAVSNWNIATQPLCRAPIFTFGSGTGPTMSFAYGPIPNKSDGTPRRGLTLINISLRIDSATSTINSNIPLTFPAVLTEIIAHEMGHTMGLNDCNYVDANNCGIGSSVMVSGAPVATWTGLQGQPGPTGCDILVVETVANDYQCCIGSSCPSRNSCPCNSPIVLDIDGTGFKLTSAANGVIFDISGHGDPVQMAWTAPGSNNAFLALPGPDGLVHSGKELFGNFTPQPSSAIPNGYAALAVYDDPKNGGNGDEIIDSRDSIFASLRLWIDSNHDGICQPNELHTLPSLGVHSLSLNYKETKKTDQYGNVFRYRAAVNPDDPDASTVGRKAYDVFFVAEELSVTKNVSSLLLPHSPTCAVPGKQLTLSVNKSGSF
jgi:hypothetical protein